MKVILLMAVTADGMIARDNAHYPDWTGKADKRMFKQITTRSGVVIFGSRTYKTIGKALPGRLNVVMTRYPDQYTGNDNLLFTADTPLALLKKLADQGYKEAVLGGGATVNSLFANQDLIDEMIITVTPTLFGQGLGLFAQPMEQALELLSTREIEPGILVLRYRFCK